MQISDQEMAIDLRAIRAFIRARIWYFVVCLLLGGIGAGVVYFCVEKTYEVDMQIYVEMQEENAQLSKGLGLLGGALSVLSNPSATKPSYALISRMLNTYSFMEPIVKKKIYFSLLDTTYSLIHYYHREQQDVLQSTRSVDSVWMLTTNLSNLEDYQHRVHVSERASVDHLLKAIEMEELEDEMIALRLEFPDPYAAYEIANHMLHRLSNYSVAFHTMREEKNLRHIEKRHAEARLKYKNARQAQAKFEDEHKDIAVSSVTLEREGLKMEAQLKYQIYSELSLQKEQAQTQLHGKAPFISIVKSGLMPQHHAFPKITIVSMMACALAICFAIFLIAIELLVRFFGYRCNLLPFLISKKYHAI